MRIAYVNKFQILIDSGLLLTILVITTVFLRCVFLCYFCFGFVCCCVLFCFVFILFSRDHLYVRSFPTCSTKMIKLPFDHLETRLREEFFKTFCGVGCTSMTDEILRETILAVSYSVALDTRKGCFKHSNKAIHLLQ